MLPLVARTAGALTRWLAPRFGEGLRIGYDADAVEALAETRQALWAKLSAADFLTVNEKRAAAGYSPVEGWRHFIRRGIVGAWITSSTWCRGRSCGDCAVCCSVMAIDKPTSRRRRASPAASARAGARSTTRGLRCAVIIIAAGGSCRSWATDWRPDRSGVFAEVEEMEGETGISLVLVGNPLKTVRQPWFADFVAWAVTDDVLLSLGIPGPPGAPGRRAAAEHGGDEGGGIGRGRRSRHCWNWN